MDSVDDNNLVQKHKMIIQKITLSIISSICIFLATLALRPVIILLLDENPFVSSLMAGSMLLCMCGCFLTIWLINPKKLASFEKTMLLFFGYLLFLCGLTNAIFVSLDQAIATSTMVVGIALFSTNVSKNKRSGKAEKLKILSSTNER